MNYTDIQTFLAISSCASLSKAAEELYISQPALSHRLRALEQELGIELITRKKGVRTIELTEAGKNFIPIAKKWQALWEETKKIHSKTASKSLSLATVDSLNIDFIPNLCTRLLRKEPKLYLNLMTLRSNMAYEALENGEIDLAFITNPHFFRKVQTIPLFEEEMQFICEVSSDYQEPLSPRQLDCTREIFIPWGNSFFIWHDYWFESRGNTKVVLDNMHNLKYFLNFPNTWSVVPSSIAKLLLQYGNFRTVAMEDAPEPRSCYAIVENQRKAEPFIQRVIEEFLDVVDQTKNITISRYCTDSTKNLKE